MIVTYKQTVSFLRNPASTLEFGNHFLDLHRFIIWEFFLMSNLNPLFQYQPYSFYFIFLKNETSAKVQVFLN